jgi:hypothetical protein
MNNIDTVIPIIDWDIYETPELKKLQTNNLESKIFENINNEEVKITNHQQEWSCHLNSLISKFIITNLPEQFEKDESVRNLVYKLQLSPVSNTVSSSNTTCNSNQQIDTIERNEDTITVKYYTHSDDSSNESSDEISNDEINNTLYNDIDMCSEPNTVTKTTFDDADIENCKAIRTDGTTTSISDISDISNISDMYKYKHTQPLIDFDIPILERITSSKFILKDTLSNFRINDELRYRYHNFDHDRPDFVVTHVISPGLYELFTYNYSLWYNRGPLSPMSLSTGSILRYYPKQLLNLLPQRCLDDLSQHWGNYLDKFIVYAQEIGDVKSCKWLMESRNYLLLSSCGYYI